MDFTLFARFMQAAENGHTRAQEHYVTSFPNLDTVGKVYLWGGARLFRRFTDRDLLHPNRRV